MNTLREAAQQALERLEIWLDEHGCQRDREAIADLRSALAEPDHFPDATKMAPVAKLVPGTMKSSHAPQPKAEQEPVLYVHPSTYAMESANQIGVWRPGCQLDDYLPLYFAPQPRKRLTDEEILAIGRELGMKCRLGGNPNIDFDYARAVEAAIWSKT
jgi:hypothetical protein